MKYSHRVVIIFMILIVIVSASLYLTYSYSYNSGYSKGYSTGVNQASSSLLIHGGTVIWLSSNDCITYQVNTNNFKSTYYSVYVTSYIHLLWKSSIIQTIEIELIVGNKIVNSTGWINGGNMFLSTNITQQNTYPVSVLLIANPNNDVNVGAQFIESLSVHVCSN